MSLVETIHLYDKSSGTRAELSHSASPSDRYPKISRDILRL
jgi:hypothetical protein